MADAPDQVASMYLRALLSSGEFSSVFVAQRSESEELVVVKSFNRAHLPASPQLLYRMMRERHTFEVMAQLPHPFLVSFRFALVDPNFAYLGMEHVGGGDLFTLLSTQGPFHPAAARVYVGEICLAIGHLHSFDFMYRDLKPENVLVGLDGHLKLADFGSATRMLGRLPDAPPPATEHSLCGTPEYMAPETLRSHPACEMVDMWGLGCLSTELLTGVTPFVRGGEGEENVPALIRRILHDEIVLPVHAHLGPLEHSFLSALLERDPTLRLGARPRGHVAVLEHPWLASISAQQFLLKQTHAPWVPLHNGPHPEHELPPPPTAAMLEQAGNHARGALLAPAAPMPALGDGLASWAPVRLDIAPPAPPAAPAAPAAAYMDDSDDDGREDDERASTRAAALGLVDGAAFGGGGDYVSPMAITTTSEQLQEAPRTASEWNPGFATHTGAPPKNLASGFVRKGGSSNAIETLGALRASR